MLFLPSMAARPGISREEGTSGEEHKASDGSQTSRVIKTMEKGWECQGGLSTELGLGRR